MFLRVEEINQRWISEKEALLADTQLLVSQLNHACGNKMQKCIDKIISLNPSHKNAIIKDPIFLNWVSDLNDEILRVYENSSAVWSDEKLNQGLNLITVAISNLAEKDFSFLSLPQVEGIKIITKRIDPFFNEGSEYDVEFDFLIDESKWLSTLGAALDLIKLDSTTHQLVKNFVSYLIPLKQKKIVQNLSFSSRNLPNVIFKNNEDSAYIFGETLAHEADHQFFYALETFYSVWNTDVKLQKAIFRSPWRDDARPLDGLIRGVSAFVRVCKYYSSVIKNVSETEIDKVGSLHLLKLSQCEDAITTLLNSNQLSDFGKDYVLEMKDILHQSDSGVKHYSNYKTWRFDAMNVINTHRENWEKVHLNQTNKK